VVVVMPAFDAEGTIDAALASIAAQSVSPTLVFVVDDASTDGTVRSAQAWADVLPVRVVSQNKAGPGPARSLAIAESTEPLIALLDADDMWLPDHLETLHAAYRSNPGIVTGDGLLWRPGQEIQPHTYRSQAPVPALDRQPLEIVRRNFIFIGSLFARCDYDAAGGFRSFAPGAEDWDLWIRMVRNGVTVTPTNHATYLYRLSPGGLTAQQDVLDRYIAVLGAAVDEAGSAAERDAARWGRDRCVATRELQHGYAAAADRDDRSARRAGRAAIRGGTRLTSAQAVALVASPRLALRLRAWAKGRYR
jgi:glycosyltransferase involved in cell wall biosynthesis